MVPYNPKDLGPALDAALDRLRVQLSKDRDTLVMYARTHPESLAKINELLRTADHLKERLLDPDEDRGEPTTIHPTPPPSQRSQE